MLSSMSAKRDDDLPPEELDMIVDEALGHPQPGPTAERLAALEQRVKYLEDSLAKTTDAQCAASYRVDLEEARRQLADLRFQSGQRN
jgi:hypothetical protein